MKKVILAILAASAIIVQTVFAENIMNINIDSFTFDVSFASEINTVRPTIQVLDEDKTSVIYLGEGTSVQEENGTYTFLFESFNVPKTLETGAYIVRIGGEGLTCAEEKIYFVNVFDKGSALNLLDSADIDGILAILKENREKLGVDLEDYLALDAAWQKTVNEAIFALNLANDCSKEQVNHKYKLFLDTFSEKMEIAVIAGGKDPQKVLTMIEKSQYLGLDKETWYSKLGVNKGWAAEILAGTDFPVTVTKQELVRAYNGAILTGVIANCDWGTGKEALSYFSKTGLVDVNISKAEALSQTNQANVFKDLKNAKIKDYLAIPSKYNELIQKYTSSGGGTGGSGGGTGGSGPVIAMQPEATPAPTVSPDTEPLAFYDLDTVEWAREAIESLAKGGVLSGDGSGAFAPQRLITREEFAKIMVSAFALYEPEAVCGFTDVPQGTWFYPYVASAKKNGLISGISAEEFGTGQNITRQDMAVILERVYAMAGSQPLGEAVEFQDGWEIADYAKPAVEILTAAGILRGTDNNTFSPRQGVTRAQGAKAVYELLQVIGG